MPDVATPSILVAFYGAPSQPLLNRGDYGSRLRAFGIR